MSNYFNDDYKYLLDDVSDDVDLIKEKTEKIPKPNFVMACPYCRMMVSGRIKISIKTCPYCLKKFNKNDYNFEIVNQGDECAKYCCNEINQILRQKESKFQDDIKLMPINDLIALYKKSK